jgi:SAM-dependent methyltransferase
MGEVAEQQEKYWNETAGETWVEFEADLEAQMADILPRLLARAGDVVGASVLDVGCGGGGSTLAFAQAVGPGGSVLGVDISAPLLALAERRKAATGLGNVSFRRGDAMVAPLGEGRFDLAVSRFGVMFFEDPITAFANIARALKPGGRVLFCCWAGPAHNPLFSVPAKAAAERLGPLPPPDPHAPGPMAFADIPRVTGILTSAGLVDAAGEAIDCIMPFCGFPERMRQTMTRMGPVGRFMQAKGGTEADLDAIAAAVEAAYAPWVTPEGLRLPAKLNFFTARKR